MTEEDIRKQLEVKNKEIFINKLKLDLNNNLEGLVLTIENVINKIILESSNRILSIAESFTYQKEIEKNMEEFYTNYVEYLMDLLDKKKKNILNIINLNVNYENCFKKETNTIIDKLNKYYKDNINELSNKIISLYDDSFCKERIDKYLKNNLKDLLENRIKDSIKSRDIILLNTFNETNLKYIELNKNTIG